MKKPILLLSLMLVCLMVVSQTIIFHENFESPSGADSLTSSGVPSWALSSRFFYSGNKSDSSKVGLANNDTSKLVTNSFSTLGNTSIILEFWHICKIEFFDVGKVQVSTNNGLTWVDLTASQYQGAGQFATQGNRFCSGSYTTWVPGTATAIPQASWWKKERFDISSLVSDAAQVKVRFLLYNGAGGVAGPNQNYGWLIDDITVMVAASELNPPLISIIPPAPQGTIYNLGPFEIKAKISDASGIDTAFVVYNKNNLISDTIGMTLLSTDTMHAFIPLGVESDTICYHIVAKDGSPNHNQAFFPLSGCTSFNITSGIHFPYTDNFDINTNLWIPDSTSTSSKWEIGAPTFGQTNSAHSAPNAWDINLTSDYTDNANVKLYSPVFDFSTAVNAKISFWINYDTEAGYDGGWLEYAINDSAWKRLGILSDPQGTNWYNDTYSSNLPFWSGSSNGWTNVEHTLSFLNNTTYPVKFRFMFRSDVSTTASGFSLDDISIVLPSPNDAGVMAIKSPNMNLCIANNEQLSVIVKNYGSLAINGNLTLAYKVDTLANVSEQFNVSINPGSEDTLTFLAPLITTGGNHSIKIYTSLPLDGLAANDTLFTTFYSSNALTLPFISNLDDTLSLSNYCVSTGTNALVGITGDAAWTGFAGMALSVNASSGWTTYSPDTIPTSASYIWKSTVNADQNALARVVVNTSGYSSLVLKFDLKLLYLYNDYNTNFRVLVNGTQITPTMRPKGTINNYVTYEYNISQFLPTPSLSVDFQSKAYYPYNYLTSGGNGVFIDNIRILEPPAFDAGIQKIVSPVSGCGLGSEIVKVKIKNYGSSAITGNLTANYKLAGSATIVSEMVNDTIALNDTLTFSFSTPLDLSVSTTDSIFKLISWTELLGDSLAHNDTLSRNVKSQFVPNSPIASNDTITYGTSATLNASGVGSILWYNAPTNGILLHNGTTFITPLLFDTTNYYVSSTYVGPGLFTVSSDSVFNTTSSYPAPYGNYYKGAHHQMLIRASELNDAGIGQGPIQSLAFNISNENGAPLTGFEIRIGTTANTELTNWLTGLTSVYATSSYTDVLGWNTHQFSTPFVWDGVSNLVIETCFDNGVSSTYTNNAIFKQSTTNYNSTLVYKTDGGNACGTSSPTAYMQRPQMRFDASGLGCSSPRIPVVVYIAGTPQIDAGAKSITSPVSGFEMTNAEAVTIAIHNFGTAAISGFPISYKINNLSPVTETVTSTINAGDTLSYTFTTPADLSVFGSYTITSYTSLVGDNVNINDTVRKTIQNSQINYCASAATSTTAYEDIGNVTISNLNNGIAIPIFSNTTANHQYTNFTSLSPANLLVGANYPISVSQINAGSNFWDAWIKAYIDYNHDGVFNDTTELVLSEGTTSSPQLATVTGTATIPANAQVGLTRMRIVMVESAAAADVSACGTYSYGETEDYTVRILPQIAHDAGIVGIITPTDTSVEGLSITPTIIVKNFGTTAITTMQVSYQINNLASVSFSFNGNIVSGTTDTVVFNAINMPAGLNSFCAYTVLANDSNSTNDTLCKNIFGYPGFDAAVTQLVSPVGGCNLSSELVKIKIYNFGHDTISGNITANYKLGDAGTVISQPVAASILPDTSIIFTFTTPADLAVVTADSSIDLISWVTLLNDHIQTNDTLHSVVESLLSPNAPTASGTTIAYGDSAVLAASGIGNITWYNAATNGNIIGNGTSFTTPNLYSTTNYYVSADYGVPGNMIVASDTVFNTTSSYPAPYGNYYKGAHHQIMIRASELRAAGIGQGAIQSLAFYVTTANSTPLNGFEIKIGSTGDSSLSTWISGLTSVYTTTSYTDVNGWNTHVFSSPYNWDGQSNLVIETCFDNGVGSTYTNNAIFKLSTTSYNSTIVYKTDAGGACSNLTPTLFTQRPQMKLAAMSAGCSSTRVPVTVTVTGSVSADAGVQLLESPNSGTNLTPNEIVIIRIKNYGTSPISNFSVSYKIGSATAVTENVTSTINSGDTLQFIFATRANLSAFATYSIKSYTSLANDGYHSNDTTIKTVVNSQIIGLTSLEKISFSLGQNIPNPASGNTTIEYSIPEKGTVSFEMLDILGQVVISSVIVNDAGKHKMEINVKQIPAGIYTYSIIYNKQRLSKRMVVSY